MTPLGWGRTMSEDKPARLPTAQHDLMGKPYAWVDGNSRIQSKQIDPLVDIPLYKKLPWQGLTAEEIFTLDRAAWKKLYGDKPGNHPWSPMLLYFYEGVEAKLKEKNGG